MTSGSYSLQLVESHPDAVIAELDKLDAAESFQFFTKLLWHVLEPRRRFVPNWHIEAIGDHLIQGIHHGAIDRLLINIPPGFMKSLMTDVFFPAWTWGPGNRPDKRFVSASYSQDLTIRDNRRMRNLIRSPHYQQLWGDRFRITPDQDSKTRFDNDKTGSKIATSTGGLGTGERADIWVVDDPHNVKDGESDAKRGTTLLWFAESLTTRLNDPDELHHDDGEITSASAIIVIMQRIHEADVSGYILEKELGYTHLMLPMEFDPKRKCFVDFAGTKDVIAEPGKHEWVELDSNRKKVFKKREPFKYHFEDPRTKENELLWKDRFGRKSVERDKKALGEYAAAGQFDQIPAPRGGGQFKRKWWSWYRTDHGTFRPVGSCDRDSVALPDTFDWVVISVDGSFKKTIEGSEVGLIIIAGKGANRYVLDDRTKARTFTESLAAIRQAKEDYPRAWRILIEDKANGTAIVDTLKVEIAGVIAIEPKGGKESRASASQPSVESGNWFLAEGKAWSEPFIHQFSVFPAGKRDDRVDAVSQAQIYMSANADMARTLMLVEGL